MDRPRVSVVIPARDAAATIARAIASAQAQAPPPAEIIVVDDASADATAAIAHSLGARVVRLATRHGPGGARNAGIAVASGDVVGFLDADDAWLAGKLAHQLAELTEARVFVACGARLFAETGADLGPLYDGAIPDAGGQAWRGLLARNTIATSTVLVWLRELRAVGGFDAALPVAEDQDLWLRLALRGPLAYVDATLVHMHRLPSSVSGVGTQLGFRQQLAVTLPMIERHIAANRARLSRRELRAIRGARLLRIGRGACWTGAWAEGAALVLRAMRLGHRPLAGLYIVLSTHPWLRRG